MLDETMEQNSDTALMARIATGDQQSYRTLVARHLPKANAITRRYLPQTQDAEEVIQDAFLQVWIHAPAFNPSKAGFGTWFYRILANKCLDHTRRRSARPQTHLDETAVTLIPDETTPAQDARLIRTQEEQRIRTAVHALPESQRLAVILCYFGEMTNSQAAQTMGLKLKALEGLLFRARRALRQSLDLDNGQTETEGNEIHIGDKPATALGRATQ